MDEKGTTHNSVSFAHLLEKVSTLGQELTFVIGGSNGLDISVRQYADYQISLSSLTFTHNFARVILEEQLYRACTIIAKKIYHK